MFDCYGDTFMNWFLGGFLKSIPHIFHHVANVSADYSACKDDRQALNGNAVDNMDYSSVISTKCKTILEFHAYWESMAINREGEPFGQRAI